MSPLFIDIYCERDAFGFWNEPVNAVSNLAFLIAAMLAWHKLSRRGSGDVWEKSVIVLAGLIGFGSFLFHTLASPWTLLADTLPIWSFVIAYTVLTVYRSTNENTRSTLLIVVTGALVTSILLWLFNRQIIISPARHSGLLNGSLQYAPALAVLFIVSAYAVMTGHRARRYFCTATAIFTLALLFRTIDLISCTATDGIGTHFLWHLLDGLMIGVLLHALVIKMPPASVSKAG